jgi:hypothetical protein
MFLIKICSLEVKMKKIFIAICVFSVFLIGCQKTTNVPVRLPELAKMENSLSNTTETKNVSVKLTEAEFIVIECEKMNSSMALKQDVDMREIKLIPPYTPYEQVVELSDVPTLIFLPKEISENINVNYYREDNKHYLSFTADGDLWGYGSKIIIVFGQKATVVNVKLEGGMGKG